MMNILKLIKGGESETVEFKKSFNKDVIESLTAMANRNGGVVLVGVSDKKEISGVQVGDESIQKWVNEIGQASEPRLIPNAIKHVIKGKTIVTFEIAPYPIKPVTFNGRGYLRVSSSNKQLNSKEIAELHLQSTHTSWDALIADRKTEEINLSLVKSYISKMRQSGRRDLKSMKDWKEVFRKLELIRDNKLTWACFLLFKKNPSASPSTIVRVARLKGTSTIIDDNFIEGALVNQVDEIMKAIKKNLKVRYVITGKAKRDEVWDYPLDAVREAVINAICHRDYMDTGDILIKIYDTRMSIWNPGKLPFNLSIDQLLKNEHSSNPRNKYITQAFYDIAEVERLGSGIQRILNACREAEVPAPEITEESGGFKIVFSTGGHVYKQSSEATKIDFVNEKTLPFNEGSESSKRQNKALDFVRQTGKITNSQYQKMNEISPRTALKELSDLVKQNLLKRIGTTGKGTFYVLSDKAKVAKHE